MNVMMAGAGGEVVWKNLSMQFALHLPVYEHTTSNNLSSAGRVVVGVTYNFNQNKYLLGN
jgi:hypothetical protein